MYSADVLSQLRTLSWLGREAARLPAESPERSLLDKQITALRERLPLSILRYHDDRAKKNLPSVANVSGTSCSNCHLKLPSGTINELAQPGRFGICPNCGVFLWSGESDRGASASPLPKPVARPKAAAKPKPARR